MQLLCIAAFLLSAAATQQLDADSGRGDDEHWVSEVPENGVGGLGVDWTEMDPGHPWLLEVPPWVPKRAKRPSGRPGNGNPRGPMRGANGTNPRGPMREANETNGQPGSPSRHPPRGPPRGKRQAPDESAVPQRGPGRRFGRPRGPPRGGRPDSRAKNCTKEFSSVFKVNDVSFVNTSAVLLKPGNNTFFLVPKGGRQPRHHQGEGHEPPESRQYVKLIYNEPNKISIEYGVVKPKNLPGGELVGEEDNPEDDY